MLIRDGWICFEEEANTQNVNIKLFPNHTNINVGSECTDYNFLFVLLKKREI
jgi:hypothetical protein